MIAEMAAADASAGPVRALAWALPCIISPDGGRVVRTFGKFEDAPRLDLAAWARDTMRLPLVNIVVGILAAFFSNYLVTAVLGDAHVHAWRWMAGVMTLPSALFLVTALLIPESPRWRVKAGRNPDAGKVLTRLGHAAPAQELAEIAESLAADERKTHRHLFHHAHLKPLLLIGSVTFIASHLLAAWAFHTHAQGWPVLVAMMGVVGSHAYSQGAVVWVIINEVLPNSVRAAGSSAACFLMWTLCAVIGWTFPVVAAKSGALVFGFFAAMMTLQFVLVWRFLPETKGVTLEAMDQRLGAH
jgi:hypothetical protein